MRSERYPTSPQQPSDPSASGRLLITAGPTHEPIDAVRFLGNRSSGTLGIALAETAADAGWDVRLALGPTPRHPREHERLDVIHYRSTADLERTLAEHAPWCDVLVMAAAVADYRPLTVGGAPVDPSGARKLRRAGGPLTIELEPTPDLLAGAAAARRPGQLLIGFALEPQAELLDSARRKLERKGVDAIVANPLETMDAADIEAALVTHRGEHARTPGRIPKATFARWLLDQITALRADT
ncbi:MAG: phosphopantothenoylcysteine decarboxylase [Planctomycetota bacterium]